MKSIRVYIEVGKQRILTGALDWPGWCRTARDEKAGLQSLLDYAPRYAQALRDGGCDFELPAIAAGQASEAVFNISERVEGNVTTDFGAPAIQLAEDKEALERAEFDRLVAILRACWRALDLAARQAAGKEMRKGPRGGGREVDGILEHILGSEQSYLSQLGGKYTGGKSKDAQGAQGAQDELTQTRETITDTLEAAFRGEIAEKGPRGGVRWQVRYFIRRMAWYTLDHAWEIVDRSG